MSKQKQPDFNSAMDCGLEGVIVCSTALSTIENSELFLRGYSLEDLAKNSSYEEVCFLLWEGWLPFQKEWEVWQKALHEKMYLTDEEKKVIASLPCKNVSAMAWLRTALSVLSLMEEDISWQDEAKLRETGLKLLAKTPLLVTYFHSLRTGREFLNSKKDKTLAWNFLYTLTGVEPSDEAVKVFDLCLLLHAEHDLNCSAFSARVTASSLSDVFSALTSAVGTLKGPLHGGANEQVMKMLEKLNTEQQAKAFVEKALTNKEKIMGFGHRIYKERDPRADILKVYSKQLTAQIGKPSLYNISVTMEEEVRSKKGLCPNVDFYSASVYHSLGIPTDLFTPVFAVSRMAGWLAHIFEQYSKNRIYRPKGKWIGKENQKWQPLLER